MVGDHHDFLRIEDFFHTDLAEFGDGDRRSDVITETTSTLQLINSPGTTDFLPQCAARIFSDKFISISFIKIISINVM